MLIYCSVAYQVLCSSILITCYWNALISLREYLFTDSFSSKMNLNWKSNLLPFSILPLFKKKTTAFCFWVWKLWLAKLIKRWVFPYMCKFNTIWKIRNSLYTYTCTCSCYQIFFRYVFYNVILGNLICLCK